MIAIGLEIAIEAAETVTEEVDAVTTRPPALVHVQDQSPSISKRRFNRPSRLLSSLAPRKRSAAAKNQVAGLEPKESVF